MKPATTAKRGFEKTRMMIVDPSLPTKVLHASVADLVSILRPGDLLVVNAASTLPASFEGQVRRSGKSIEVRLAAFIGTDSRDLHRWMAVSFGSGNWRVPTEQRGPAPSLTEGDVIEMSDDLQMHVRRVDPSSPRLLEIEWHSRSLTRELYRRGRPIQYSYQEEELALWDQQTLFHGPPVSVEPPSAAFPLTWSLILKLKALRVSLAPTIHSAGLSSAGDTALDARLPLAEYFEVPDATLREIESTRKRGGRVVALGTSVTRAIESALATGRRKGLTSLKLGERSRVYGVDILITGMHEDGTSHAELMKAFCDCETLKAAEAEAQRKNYRSHEYGDLMLLNCGSR